MKTLYQDITQTLKNMSEHYYKSTVKHCHNISENLDLYDAHISRHILLKNLTHKEINEIRTRHKNRIEIQLLKQKSMIGDSRKNLEYYRDSFSCFKEVFKMSIEQDMEYITSPLRVDILLDDIMDPKRKSLGSILSLRQGGRLSSTNYHFLKRIEDITSMTPLLHIFSPANHSIARVISLHANQMSMTPRKIQERLAHICFLIQEFSTHYMRYRSIRETLEKPIDVNASLLSIALTLNHSDIILNRHDIARIDERYTKIMKTQRHLKRAKKILEQKPSWLNIEVMSRFLHNVSKDIHDIEISFQEYLKDYRNPK